MCNFYPQTEPSHRNGSVSLTREKHLNCVLCQVVSTGVTPCSPWGTKLYLYPCMTVGPAWGEIMRMSALETKMSNARKKDFL